MANLPDPRNIQYLPLAELKDDPRNPKEHDLETIDASINRFGVLDLIVLDERTGQIISGHGRKHTLEGMQARGETPPDGVQQDDHGNWLVPVVTGWSSRSDTEAAAALIAMNRTTELGGWLDEELLTLLDEISADTTMEGIGFDESDLAALDTLLDQGVSDLDALAEEYGDVTDEDLMEDVTLTLTPETAQELRDAIGDDPKHHERMVKKWLA